MRGWGAELARGTSGGTTWYLADRLGSVRGEYGTAASVTGKTNYDPFGQPEVGTGLGAPSDYGFTGEPQDAATGLVQLRARWYQPGGGQFVSRDPFAGEAGTPQTLNPYAYAHNDPTTLTDPTGMSPLREPGGGGTSGASSAAPVVASQASEEGFLCVDATGTILFIFPSVREFLLYAYKLGKIVVPAAGVAGPVGVLVAGACVLAPEACLLVGVAAGAVAIAAGVVVVAKLIEPKHLPAQDPAGRPVAQPGPAPCPLDPNGEPDCSGRPATAIKKKEGCDKAACETYKASFKVQELVGEREYVDYQRRVAGPVQYYQPWAGGLYADGINCDKCEFVEAKFAYGPKSAYVAWDNPYINGQTSTTT